MRLSSKLAERLEKYGRYNPSPLTVQHIVEFGNWLFCKLWLHVGNPLHVMKSCPYPTTKPTDDSDTNPNPS